MGRMLSSSGKPVETRPVAIQSSIAAKPVSLLPEPARKVQLMDPAEANPLRKLAFYAGLATIFIRFAILPELLAYFTGSNTYILYLVGPVAVVGCVLTGGLQRVFRSRAAYLWVALFGWMILSTPFSSWKGDSAMSVFVYGRTNFIFLFLAAGLAYNWKEVRALMYTIGLSGLVNLMAARLFAIGDSSGRLSLDMGGNVDGIISNSNDLAAHLMLVLPFILFLAIKPGRVIFIRIFLGLGIMYGIWVILGTGSRGALVGLITVAIFCLARATMTQRIGFLIAAPIVLALLIPVLPQSIRHRLATLFVGTDQPSTDEEEGTAESTASRVYLFKQSVRFTLEHPIFGVGPRQFANFEGSWSRSQGQRGNWHETHCAYTQISSECGVPALLFFVGGLLVSVRLVNQTFKKARSQHNKEIANASFCLLLALVGYMATASFLAIGYSFTFPALVSLAIALHFVGEKVLVSASPVRVLSRA